jgi:hypothetical protein
MRDAAIMVVVAYHSDEAVKRAVFSVAQPDRGQQKGWQGAINDASARAHLSPTYWGNQRYFAILAEGDGSRDELQIDGHTTVINQCGVKRMPSLNGG